VDSDGNGVVDYYNADVVTAQDYYPFGMTMPGRKFNSGSYRYGYNGKEKDPETYGEGNIYDYGFRIYNPRLGKFLSVDPLTKSYPWYTPYQFAGNKPINSIDVDGLEDHNVVTNAVDNSLTSSGADHKPANDPVAHGNNITPWKDLLNFKAPQAVWDKTKERIGTQIIPFTTTNTIQTIESGNSAGTNFDYYAVKITALPKSIKDGAQLFDFIRSNLGSFVDDKTSFGGYSSEERSIWDSQNPVGSVLSFDAKFTGLNLNLDDASVMTSSYYKGNGGGYWTFTTLSTRGDGEHPIAGTRQFGLTDNKDGSYTFYTRGTDRGYGMATTVAGAETIFKSAEITWSTLMSNIFTNINNSGGSALIPSTPISKRVDWEEVKKLNK
jgi:RHS repeat-associated protein